MKTATKTKKSPVIITPEKPPIGVKLEVIQSIADGIRQELDDLNTLISDVAKTAGVDRPIQASDTVTPKKPYDDEHQPFTFGPAPMHPHNWINPETQEDMLDRELALQQIEEFTRLNGGFRATPCTTDPLDKGAESVPSAVCFFSDEGPVAVNRGGLRTMTNTKPLIVGGASAATGMYVPFGVCKDPEAVQTTRKVMDVILDKDREVPIHEFMAMNGML